MIRGYLAMSFLVVVILVCFDIVVCQKHHLKLCGLREHVDGQWLYNNISRQFNTYSSQLQSGGEGHGCCGASLNRNQYRSNPFQADIAKLPAVCSKNDAIRNDSSGETCCKCLFDAPLSDDVQRSQLWEWIPDNCRLLHFEAVPFCHALQGRKIIFIGDSLMQADHYTLTTLIITGGGNCQHQLLYAKSFYLFYESGHSDHTVEQYVVRNMPDIVIMNAGAKLAQEDEVRTETIPKCLEQIEAAENYLKKNDQFKSIKYFFRTQYGAHVGCYDQTQPLSVYDPLHVFEGNSTTPTLPYNWHHFQQYDRDAIRLTNNTKLGILDVSPFYLRADAHFGWKEKNGEIIGDCLHYQTPGALQLTSRIIYNALITGEM